MFSCDVGVKGRGRGAFYPPTRDWRGGDERGAYSTAMTTTDSYAARVAVKVAKATQETMSLMGSVRNLPTVNGARLSLAAFPKIEW